MIKKIIAILAVLVFLVGCTDGETVDNVVSPTVGFSTTAVEKPKVNDVNCDSQKATLYNSISSLNNCGSDSDCTAVKLKGCFGCSSLINENSDIAKLNRDIVMYYSQCASQEQCLQKCGELPTELKCVQSRCYLIGEMPSQIMDVPTANGPIVPGQIVVTQPALVVQNTVDSFVIGEVETPEDNSQYLNSNINKIISDPKKYENKIVLLKDVKFGGHKLPGDYLGNRNACIHEPESKSDLMVYDEGGCIYYNDGAEVIKHDNNPIDPDDESTYGTWMSVKGVVKIASDGKPYLSD